VIIVSLEIENYKQFAGTHRISFPAEGAVAVIGHNGAGKTTLFEAIEWALYGPRSIAASDIRPRQGTGGAPAVCVTLQTSDGKVYQVERRFKGRSKSAEAAIHELDEHGEIARTVVTGPREVTQRVAGTLVGLSHQAFISTFFTRQKELSFFADQKDADRRRQVSKLLGLETIRDAQELIGEDRRSRESEARGLRSQFEQQSAGLDFTAERARRSGELLSAEGAAEEAEQAVNARSAERQQVEESVAYWEGLRQRDDELQKRIGAGEGQIATGRDRIAGIDRQLGRLAEREAELTRLESVAAREPELKGEFDRWQRERDRAAQERTLSQRLAETAQRRQNRITTLRRIVAGDETVPGWAWRAEDGDRPAAGADRLRGVALAIDLGQARAYADATARAALAGTDHDAAGKKSEGCRKLLAQLRADLDALFVDGDPSEVARAAQQRQTAAAAAWAAASAQAKALSTEIGKLRRSIAQLRDEGSGTCPTCNQPIDEVVIQTLQEGIADRERQVAGFEAEATTSRRAADEAGADLTTAQARQERVSTLRERIRNGETTTAEAQAAYESSGEALREALGAAGTHEVPSEETVQAAGRRVEEQSRVAGQADRLGDLADQFRDDEAREAETRRELDDLGAVAYDETALRAAERALGEAQAARGQVGEIRNELDQRPRLATDRAATEAEIDARQADVDQHGRERAEVGFDQDALTSARDERNRVVDLLLQATDRRNEAENKVRDARRAIEQIDQEEQRLAALAFQAGEAEQAADELQRMYGGFTEFERWVAQRMNPLLADRASEILAEVTNGAYDRVRFDDDYGLHVYDGDEDFPVSQFSGGERDVAALAARLALSRLIGAQAAHPPAFVVLDEVFGSLDQERRGRLLGMLDALTNDDTEGFRQLFVISHVDDVRQSQAFDEVWRIEADAQGISQWENLQQTGGIEEL
jgi:exonuclease SbcC